MFLTFSTIIPRTQVGSNSLNYHFVTLRCPLLLFSWWRLSHVNLLLFHGNGCNTQAASRSSKISLIMIVEDLFPIYVSWRIISAVQKRSVQCCLSLPRWWNVFQWSWNPYFMWRKEYTCSPDSDIFPVLRGTFLIFLWQKIINYCTPFNCMSNITP